jgi:uncharacterized protein YbjT (DUF2867 family)
MILILGASGFLGREVTKRLLSEGQQVRLLVRTPAKVTDLRLTLDCKELTTRSEGRL